jgi:hypothetical protein
MSCRQSFLLTEVLETSRMQGSGHRNQIRNLSFSVTCDLYSVSYWAFAEVQLLKSLALQQGIHLRLGTTESPVQCHGIGSATLGQDVL